MTERVAVIGAGSWGTTIAKILAENTPEEVLLWARRNELCAEINETRRNQSYLPEIDLPRNLVATPDLERACRGCRLIFFVVPSHGFREQAFQIGDYVSGEHVIVHATKGIEQGTARRMSEILREETCVRKIGVLSGPNLARELAQRQPAGTLIASGYDEVVRRAQAVLNNSYFRVYGGRDVVGAEAAGAFKNIVALAAGMVDGLKLGDNSKALLVTRGLNEMARFGQHLGGSLLTFGGMAGLGDLVATCASPYSRNHRVGERLALGEPLMKIQAEMQMVAEGTKTARPVHAYATTHGLELPIVAGVNRALDGTSVSRVLDELMSIPAGAEFP
jgi:glycerol-3-phosphate dehydrogenase (NAD(P)+)